MGRGGPLGFGILYWRRDGGYHKCMDYNMENYNHGQVISKESGASLATRKPAMGFLGKLVIGGRLISTVETLRKVNI